MTHLRRRVARALQAALLACGAPAGWLVIRWLDGEPPAESLRADPALLLYMLLGTAAVFGAFAYLLGRREGELEQANRRLGELSVTDGLTGLRNSRYYFARLEEEYARERRGGRPIAVAVLDLDHFKNVNDRYGHLVGDLVLASAARAIASVTREGETEARVGGEEFALLLPGSDGVEARDVAERVRRAIGACETRVPGTGELVRVTASAGVASTADLDVAQGRELYHAADQALYRAKTGGRDRTVVASAAEVGS